MELDNFTFAARQAAASANRNSHGKDRVCQKPTKAEIQAWIISYLARLLEVDSDEIDTATPFDRYGLDSSAAVGMTGDLEDWLDIELEPTLIYDYPTIKALTQYLAEEF